MFGKGHQRVPAARLEVLRGLPMFEHFSDDELATIDALGCQMLIEPGGVLIAQGRAGREAFIVCSGDAEVRVDGDVVAHVRAGDVVGEMALLDNMPRSASVVAVTPLQVFVVDPRQFAMLFSDPRTARWIAVNLAQRLRTAEHPESLAVAGH
jgi:CRP/FNR family cyclic AMP-dependent transcriptional regulator